MVVGGQSSVRNRWVRSRWPREVWEVETNQAHNSISITTSAPVVARVKQNRRQFLATLLLSILLPFVSCFSTLYHWHTTTITLFNPTLRFSKFASLMKLDKNRGIVYISISFFYFLSPLIFCLFSFSPSLSIEYLFFIYYTYLFYFYSSRSTPWCGYCYWQSIARSHLIKHPARNPRAKSSWVVDASAILVPCPRDQVFSLLLSFFLTFFIYFFLTYLLYTYYLFLGHQPDINNKRHGYVETTTFLVFFAPPGHSSLWREWPSTYCSLQEDQE